MAGALAPTASRAAGRRSRSTFRPDLRPPPSGYTHGMAFKEALLAEFDHEIGSTRRLLERVPDASLGWKPHEKSYSLGDLSGHIANLLTWMNRILDSADLDLGTVSAELRPTSPASRNDVLQRLDLNAQHART